MPTTAGEIVAANMTAIRRRIARAAESAGRRPEEVRLVAVTKYVDAATARWVVDAGCRDIGESRPQKLWEKSAALEALFGPDAVRRHLIGPLQRNKVRRTLECVDLIHSGDSLRLLQAIDAETAAAGRRRTPVLLEVNVSGEGAKHGFAPDDVPPLCDALEKLSHIDVAGLMAMAAHVDAPTHSRHDFAHLRELRDRLRRDWRGLFALDELSMGMSGDFEHAIAEGATIVRIGSALFEGVA